MIISFGSIKGGVGKTTIAAHLAVYMLTKGIPFVLVRADSNKDLDDWIAARESANQPPIPVYHTDGNIKKTLSKINTEVVLIDVAGHESIELKSAIAASDIFVTPVCPSSLLEVSTIYGISVMVRDYQKINPNVKAFTLLNQCSTDARNNDAKEFVEYLNSDENWLQPLKTRISDIKAYRNSINRGLGIHEMKRCYNLSTAKAQIELLAAELGI
ncbi:TPA: plasmid stability/partitioning protein [Providencia rettgeri]|nr:plasmid stability/partitioning protein [Providencia rettgeri]HEM7189763.1 plasmid stability/partitioning protein [Providencia rettgeri]